MAPTEGPRCSAVTDGNMAVLETHRHRPNDHPREVDRSSIVVRTLDARLHTASTLMTLIDQVVLLRRGHPFRIAVGNALEENKQPREDRAIVDASLTPDTSTESL